MIGDFPSLVLEAAPPGSELDRARLRARHAAAHARSWRQSSGHSDAYQHVVEEINTSNCARPGGTENPLVRADMVFLDTRTAAPCSRPARSRGRAASRTTTTQQRLSDHRERSAAVQRRRADSAADDHNHLHVTSGRPAVSPGKESASMFRHVILAASLVLASLAPVFAQDASVVGTVVDESKSVLPGVTLTATHARPAGRIPT